MDGFEQQIDEWIAGHRDELVKDIRRVVEIRSVADEVGGEHPYGEGCAKALDEMLAMAREYGFATENHGYRCGSILSPGESGGKTFGLWGHLDVVPEGDGWIYPPYACTEKEGFLIGRGVGDNKGPTVTDLYVMRCIRDLGIPFRGNIRLVAGCCEETGMSDVVSYVKNQPVPDYSLVTDCGFPVCHGEKGICELELISPVVAPEVKEFRGGVASNVVPDRAEAILEKRFSGGVDSTPDSVEVFEENGSTRIVAKGFTAHAASPDNGVDAIALLCWTLADWKGGDAAVFDFLARACGCFHGEVLGISYEDGVSGALTCVGSLASLQEGRLHVGFNIRYPVTTDTEWMLGQVRKACMENGFECVVKTMDSPNYVEKDTAFVKTLMKVCQQVTGEASEPYVMGGGTYARKIPNAVGFGPGAPADSTVLNLPAGHGGCHAPDEVQSVENLLRAMKIYILALLELDRMA